MARYNVYLGMGDESTSTLWHNPKRNEHLPYAVQGKAFNPNRVRVKIKLDDSLDPARQDAVNSVIQAALGENYSDIRIEFKETNTTISAVRRFENSDGIENEVIRARRAKETILNNLGKIPSASHHK